MLFKFDSWTMTKEDLEKTLGRTMDEKTFFEICEEIDGRIDNFFNAIIEDIAINFDEDWAPKGV